MKISNDKYYTPKSLAKHCIDKVFEVMGHENITEIIEPSAGTGSFSHQIPQCIAYDLFPRGEDIMQQDFLTLELPYKEGRLFIGNPPYGRCMSLAQKFFKRAIDLGDYVAFILPISQLDNSRSLYQFDLIHSEDLGKRRYTGRTLHCCFNIYRRPENELNKKPQTKLRDVTIIRQDSKRYDETDNYDLRMCYWGDASAGKILSEGESYSAEYKIIINNPQLREQIIECLHSVDWHSELNKIAMLKIQQFHIVEALKKRIEGIM